MSRKIADLRQMSDDEVIAEHDAISPLTSVGVSYYLDELDRRSRDRSSDASLLMADKAVRLAKATLWLTVAAVFIGLISLAVALIALLQG